MLQHNAPRPRASGDLSLAQDGMAEQYQRQAAGQDAAGPAVEPLVAPVELRRAAAKPETDRLAWRFALVLALAAHGALIYALAREPEDLMAGGGGRLLDTISVTIVSSDVLESRVPDLLQPAAPAAAAPVDVNDGAADGSPAPPLREQKKETQEEEKPPEEPVRTADADIEVPVPMERQRQPDSAAVPSGGEAVRGDSAADTEASGPASASAGAVREYARHVSLALGKTKPKSAGGTGTVRIKIVIRPGGGLDSAEVAESSGSRHLDETALAAVRRTSFPVPPVSMSLAQLTFEVPYYFR